MNEHEYLSLKIGDIYQYSMVVKEKALPYWKKFGWLTFTEIDLPQGYEKAYIIFGKVEEDEILVFNKPALLRDVMIDKLVGLKVTGVTTHLGSYGMGGAGFFGLLLENSEYLTYAAWESGEYVIIDNRVVECFPNLYHKTRPWLSNWGDDQNWDELSNYIHGSKIESISWTKDTCTLKLKKLEKIIEVSFVRNDKRIPRLTGRKRNAYKKGVITDYIVFQHKSATLHV